MTGKKSDAVLNEMFENAYKIKMFVDESLSIPFNGGINAQPGERGIVFFYIANLSDKDFVNFSLETKDPIKIRNFPHMLRPGEKRKLEMIFKMPKYHEPEFTIKHKVTIPPPNCAETHVISDRIFNAMEKKNKEA